MAHGRGHPILGCLGCLPRLLLVLAFGVIVVAVVIAITSPWAYFLGGKFNIMANWSGWGTLRTENGRYVVLVRIGPRVRSGRRGVHISRGADLSGSGYLCSPRGEIFRMNVSGSMRSGIGPHTDGEKIVLGLDQWPLFWGSFTSDHRPAIELRGQWRNPDIVADDHGSISRAFNPDGIIYRGGGPGRPYPGDIVPVTLVPGSYADFEAACKAR